MVFDKEAYPSLLILLRYEAYLITEVRFCVRSIVLVPSSWASPRLGSGPLLQVLINTLAARGSEALSRAPLVPRQCDGMIS